MGLDGVSFTNESSTDFDLRGDYRSSKTVYTDDGVIEAHIHTAHAVAYIWDDVSVVIWMVNTNFCLNIGAYIENHYSCNWRQRKNKNASSLI